MYIYCSSVCVCRCMCVSYWKLYLRCHALITHSRWVNTSRFVLKYIRNDTVKTCTCAGRASTYQTCCIPLYYYIRSGQHGLLFRCSKISLYGAMSEAITVNLLKTCDSYNPCCALFRIKDVHYLKYKQKALIRISMQH